MADPRPPKLPDPAATPRLTKTGRQERDRPIYRQKGGEGFGAWEVEVTPLVGTTHIGRALTGGRLKPRAVFEVRAAYYGPGLPEFGSQPNTRMIPHTHTEDEELALAIARTLETALRSGKRELDIVGIARDVERRRG
ncbi:MAG TPA: hypothetical protein VNY83_04380 [Solirubrobacterales bacterium]|nr:hypothetical protein [Solirubrobacterales bacterium]